jgi:hypothetical protein
LTARRSSFDRLFRLAANIVEAILDGRQPKGLRLAREAAVLRGGCPRRDLAQERKSTGLVVLQNRRLEALGESAADPEASLGTPALPAGMPSYAEITCSGRWH